MVRTAGRWIIDRIVRSDRVRRALAWRLVATDSFVGARQLRFALPGHFYSPLPDLTAIEQEGDRLFQESSHADGVDLRTAAQLTLLDELAEFCHEFDWPIVRSLDRRYFCQNGYFENGDGVILAALMRRWKPRRILEVGSGFSSALMLDVNDRFCQGSVDLCFIEPYPERLKRLLTPRDHEQARLLQTSVQRVALSEFSRLEANDLLFIDSSHVSKAGSDVNFLLFEALPRLARGVVIHFHDIFYPWEYPREWLREGRAWNELYLLRAFLQCNDYYEVVLFNSFLQHRFPEIWQQHIPSATNARCGSLWLRKK